MTICNDQAVLGIEAEGETKSDFSLITLNKIVSLLGQLTDRFLELDPFIESGYKFKRGIHFLVDLRNDA